MILDKEKIIEAIAYMLFCLDCKLKSGSGISKALWKSSKSKNKYRDKANIILKALARELPLYQLNGFDTKTEIDMAAAFYCQAYHQLREFGNE